MIASSLTKYPDVNEIIDFFVRGVFPALEGNILGIYLTGSLSYGAFNYHSSDIDITVIVQRPVSRSELDSIGRLHREIEEATFVPKGELDGLGIAEAELGYVRYIKKGI